jgi:hypothetical protein
VVCDSDGIAVGVIASDQVLSLLATARADEMSFNAGVIATKS